MFADVILPLPLSETYTYSVPAEMYGKIGLGFRVIVSFGSRKYYTAIVIKLHNNAPKGFKIKEIHSLIDTHPIVLENQLKLWEWISFYYLSTLGYIYKAAVPSQFRMESETFLSLNHIDFTDIELTPTESKICDYLQLGKPAKIAQISKDLKIKNILPHIYSLTSKEAIISNENIHQKFIPKTENHLRINPEIDNKDIPTLIGKAVKQQHLYNLFIALLAEKKVTSLNRKELLELTQFSSAVLNGLLAKNILIQFPMIVDRLNSDDEIKREPFPLNASQEKALVEIMKCFQSKNTCLLHGVTSSGKTEIYIHLIEQMFAKSKQTLYLVPEIALTTQLTKRLKEVFGAKLGIYHSKINDSERTEIWQKMLSDNPYEIIIGVRSSLFLPFTNLGLVIVDEEHETSYKQQDPAPRYNARDSAVMLAYLNQAKTLLGSATPSLETYFNTKSGKYGLVTLTKRYEDIQMPEIIFENTKELHRKRKIKSLLAPNLIDHINEAIESGDQVILFRNRRGFAPMVECKTCGWTPKCKHCDVTLTYHKHGNVLRCHYCNTVYKMPVECLSCHEKDSLETLGQGTEQLEEEATKLFPQAVVARLDSDSTRSIDSYSKIINDFQEGKAQILVGTQMLSKGLDFDNVSIVGIISADSLMNYPDFRSFEHGFQLIMQASGRCGRKNKQGKVFIQSGDPEQPIYQFISNNDYESFFTMQLAERKLFKYPPYYRLIKIIIKHKEEKIVESAASYLTGILKQSLND
ncbi:MAG: primosomal protein N', partial [Dysgonamonadaceae bacterium]